MTRSEAKELYTPKSTYAMKMRFIDKIYNDHKSELLAEYKRGWNDRHTQRDLESRTCESCKHFQDGICYNTAVCLMNGGEYILIAKEFSCNRYESKV